MKNQYIKLLTESLIDVNSELKKYEGTAGDIVNHRGTDTIATHKSVKDVVSVLERFYMKEDSDEINLVGDNSGGEEAVGEPKGEKVQPDHTEDALSTPASKADGAALPNANQPNEFKDTIMDRDDATAASKTGVASEAIFEDEDLDLPAEEKPAEGTEAATDTGNVEPAEDEAEIELGDTSVEPQNDCAQIEAVLEDEASGEGDPQGLPEEKKDEDDILGDVTGDEAKKVEEIVSEEADGDNATSTPNSGEAQGDPESDQSKAALGSEPNTAANIDQPVNKVVESLLLDDDFLLEALITPPSTSTPPAAPMPKVPESDVQKNIQNMAAEEEPGEDVADLSTEEEPVSDVDDLSDADSDDHEDEVATDIDNEVDADESGDEDVSLDLVEDDVEQPTEEVPVEGAPAAPVEGEVPVEGEAPAVEEPLDVDAVVAKPEEECAECGSEMTLEQILELADLDLPSVKENKKVETKKTTVKESKKLLEKKSVTKAPSAKATPAPAPKASVNESVIQKRKNTEEKIVEKLIREFAEMDKLPEDGRTVVEESVEEDGEDESESNS